MLDDPFDVAQPFVPQERKPQFQDTFYQQLQDMRPTEGRTPLGTVNICRYLNGRHEMPPQPWCPHYDREDETGNRIRPDWTVQED